MTKTTFEKTDPYYLLHVSEFSISLSIFKLLAFLNIFIFVQSIITFINFDKLSFIQKKT